MIRRSECVFGRPDKFWLPLRHDGLIPVVALAFIGGKLCEQNQIE
jgi:hypothetical protein